MREIKFRIFDAMTKILHYNVSGKSLDIYSFSLNRNPNLGSVSQYTGLKDKNEKEIYEEDVLKYERLYDDGKTEGLKTFTAVVSWCKGCFYLVESKSVVHRLGSHDVEVIGNIYENPELLNELP